MCTRVAVQRRVTSQHGRALGPMSRNVHRRIAASSSGENHKSGGNGNNGGSGSGNGAFSYNSSGKQTGRGNAMWMHQKKKKNTSSVVGSQSTAVKADIVPSYDLRVDRLVSEVLDERDSGSHVSVDYMNMASTTRAVVLAGGEQNNPLTKYRAMPAVPIGCCMLLIDVPINNCLSAGINKMYVMTQFQSHGLHSHIATSYPPQGFGSRAGGWVDVLAAQQTINGKEWYKGSADAIRRNLGELKDESRGS